LLKNERLAHWEPSLRVHFRVHPGHPFNGCTIVEEQLELKDIWKE
jgi:hypothetical protein